MNEKLLLGHVSPETAYLVRDYPFGRYKRCVIRFWLESKRNFGVRFCSQTSVPLPGLTKGSVYRPEATDKEIMESVLWNKPKHGNYFLTCVMYIGPETGHVCYRALSMYDSKERVKEFLEFSPDDKLAQALLTALENQEKRRAQENP